MLLIQVAAALLVLSARQNILHEGKPLRSLYLNIQVLSVDTTTSTISFFQDLLDIQLYSRSAYDDCLSYINEAMAVTLISFHIL